MADTDSSEHLSNNAIIALAIGIPSVLLSSATLFIAWRAKKDVTTFSKKLKSYLGMSRCHP
ncbi:hypothetical protein PG999_010231 [Apiospora kogelbergensis]|uniref:Uncharacterized protein n=1 Tax=Apiospora kogelbergensis TaxID=1337665 RepID=A0AAW0QAW8_9PEZI